MIAIYCDAQVEPICRNQVGKCKRETFDNYYLHVGNGTENRFRFFCAKIKLPAAKAARQKSNNFNKTITIDGGG